MSRAANYWDTLRSEELKRLTEFGLHTLAKQKFGDGIFYVVRRGSTVEDPRLKIKLGTIKLDNPLIVGAGWDKTGRSVDGLHALGFAGVEVGSVQLNPQPGNPKPRLWYKEGAALNWFGFNSEGADAVVASLKRQKRRATVGISIGKNKWIGDDEAPEAYAETAKKLHQYADYFVVNVSSPNTPGLRELLNPKPLADIVKAVNNVLDAKGKKPLYVKTTIDLSVKDLDKVLQVCIDNKLAGIIDSNTTLDKELKARYGWEDKPGGLSGDVAEFRDRVNQRMKHITRTTAGTGLHRIGVGGINDAASAIERLESGAEAIQLVTAIRQYGGKLARNINTGLVAHLDSIGAKSITDIVGSKAARK